MKKLADSRKRAADKRKQNILARRQAYIRKVKAQRAMAARK